MKIKNLQTVFGWIAFVFSILGTILNAQLNVNGFLFWIISNVILIVVNFQNKKWYMVTQFLFLTIMSVYGYLNWLKLI